MVSAIPILITTIALRTIRVRIYIPGFFYYSLPLSLLALVLLVNLSRTVL